MKKMQNWVKRGHVGNVTQFCNFGTPVISREPLKLQTSNLAKRRTAVSYDKKRKIRAKRVTWGSRDPLLGPPNISQTVELANSNLARRLTAVSSNERKCKIG